MDIQIKFLAEDGNVYFSTYESWKVTEDEAFMEAMQAFRASHSCKNKILFLKNVTLGADRNWNE